MSELKRYTKAMLRGDDATCCAIEQEHGVYGLPPEMVSTVLAGVDAIAQLDELLEFAQEVRRSGDTRLASMAIAIIAKAKGGEA